jgi:hypothetical protein
MFKRRLLQKIFNKSRRGDILTKRIDIKDYQKPEIVLIDDPAFEETGQGDSGIWTPPGLSGNSQGQNGNSQGKMEIHRVKMEIHRVKMEIIKETYYLLQ